MLDGCEGTRAQTKGAVWKRAEGAMDERGAMETRSNGDLEASVKNRAEILGRQSLRHDQRKGANVRGRIPAAGDRPALCAFDPVHNALELFDFVSAERVGCLFDDPGDPGRESRDAQNVW